MAKTPIIKKKVTISTFLDEFQKLFGYYLISIYVRHVQRNHLAFDINKAFQMYHQIITNLLHQQNVLLWHMLQPLLD